MYLGIDIGTSGVKSVLMDGRGRVLGQATAPLDVSRPRPLWSEQDPEDWWGATQATLDRLAADHPNLFRQIQAIGLSGQMLGVTLVGADGRALRPAMLWNDGRATVEGRELEGEIEDFAGLTGARPMPGFSAPKLRWLHRHEPALLEQARWVMLPKDFVRLKLTGDAVTDRADGSATLLMDTMRGEWHDGIRAACGLGQDRLPRLIESGEIGGMLRTQLAARWGLPAGTPIVGGGGDNMCGGIGAGVTAAGDGYISLGTSGVYFVANDRFVPARDRGMHTHRHAAPGLFCQHGVVLSAAAALTWVARMVGAEDVGKLVRQVEAAALPPEDTPVFTPYLAGERTPHDRPDLTAAFSGLTLSTTPLHLVQAVLEGVALAILDCHDALQTSGVAIRRIALIGGGSQSPLWGRLIASAIGMPLALPAGAAFGPALGAALLARSAVEGPLERDGRLEDAPVEIAVCAATAASLAAKREAYRQQGGWSG